MDFNDMKIDRRKLVGLMAASAAGPAYATAAFAATTPNALRVVIVGGGMAGATAAKYLKYWAKMYDPNWNVSVTLIEKNASTFYFSNIRSNEALVGAITPDSLKYTYAKLLSDYGVTVAAKTVASVDVVNKKVKCTDNSLYAYDRLILAAGIDFDYSPERLGITLSGTGASWNLLPHAWDGTVRTNGKTQIEVLKTQLTNMLDGSRVIISIPPKPYRCPPGPYERACVIADWLKSKKPQSKVIVLDANTGPVVDGYGPLPIVEPKTFGKAFGIYPGSNQIHKNYIEYYPSTRITSVEFKANNQKVVRATNTTSGATLTFGDTNAGQKAVNVVNVIPPMKAGKIVIDVLKADNGLTPTKPSGLDAAGLWAPVNEATYESSIPYYAGIHIIGDSQASGQPKAGHIGNQEGKVVADAILRAASGRPLCAAPETNSACFTPITTPAGNNGPTASWLTAIYRYQEDTTTSPPGPSKMRMVSGDGINASEPLGGWTGDNYDNMTKWFTALMQDVSFK